TQRKNLFIQYMQKTKIPEVHDYLVKITLAKMVEIAKGDFHPVARYNAVVLIGELNQKELVQVGGATPPEPFSGMVPPLVEALTDPKQLDVVKVAALMGLFRYVEWDSKQPVQKRLPPAVIDQIDAACLQIINDKAPAGRSLDGHVWMQ